MDYTLTRIDPNGENDRYPCKLRKPSAAILSSNMSTVVFTWVNLKTPCMTW